jgi:hypothetical protein
MLLFEALEHLHPELNHATATSLGEQATHSAGRQIPCLCYLLLLTDDGSL